MNPTPQFRAPSASEMPDQPNPWATVHLRPDAPALPRWVRMTLRLIVGGIVAWVCLIIFAAIVLAL
jgi:hypothetical protein